MSWSSVSTSVGDTVCSVPEIGTLPEAGWTSSWAVAEYRLVCRELNVTATATHKTTTASSQWIGRLRTWMYPRRFACVDSGSPMYESRRLEAEAAPSRAGRDAVAAHRRPSNLQNRGMQGPVGLPEPPSSTGTDRDVVSLPGPAPQGASPPVAVHDRGSHGSSGWTA